MSNRCLCFTIFPSSVELCCVSKHWLILSTFFHCWCLILGLALLTFLYIPVQNTFLSPRGKRVHEPRFIIYLTQPLKNVLFHHHVFFFLRPLRLSSRQNRPDRLHHNRRLLTRRRKRSLVRPRHRRALRLPRLRRRNRTPKVLRPRLPSIHRHRHLLAFLPRRIHRGRHFRPYNQH